MITQTIKQTVVTTGPDKGSKVISWDRDNYLKEAHKMKRFMRR